ncbi:hypothetical protein V8G54_007592 [Vigna mungo]|uniref:Uncharacterized protein n=1 Tax=Vigna mungo TaxID=3915 RepID=A0AAQ3P253_VIGMU
MHCILFMTNGSRNNFSVDVIVQMLPQTTLNRKGFIQKLFIEALFGFMNKNHSFPMLIKLRAPSTTHHLQNISDWKINIPLCFSIIVLSSLDNHKMSWKIHTPSQCAGTN